MGMHVVSEDLWCQRVGMGVCVCAYVHLQAALGAAREEYTRLCERNSEELVVWRAQRQREMVAAVKDLANVQVRLCVCVCVCQLRSVSMQRVSLMSLYSLLIVSY